MDYDTELYARSFHITTQKFSYHYYTYRSMPVPGISNRRYRFYGWYKNMRMYKRERSLYYEDGKYSRDKRSPRNLPDPWDDRLRSDIRTRKSWKNRKGKKQWEKHLLK